MELLWSRKSLILTCKGRKINAWSQVRNELNGYRPSVKKIEANEPDIFYITDKNGRKGSPSMPRPFPSGSWQVTGWIPHSDSMNDGYLYPWFMATNAHQPLEVWELDNGFYEKGTEQYEIDYFYGVHFSSSDWTQGCLRVETEEGIRWLKDNVPIGTPFIVS